MFLLLISTVRTFTKSNPPEDHESRRQYERSFLFFTPTAFRELLISVLNVVSMYSLYGSTTCVSRYLKNIHHYQCQRRKSIGTPSVRFESKMNDYISIGCKRTSIFNTYSINSSRVEIEKKSSSTNKKIQTLQLWPRTRFHR